MELRSSIATLISSPPQLADGLTLHASPEVRGKNLHVLLSSIPGVQLPIPDERSFANLFSYLDAKLPVIGYMIENLLESGTLTGRLFASVPLLATVQKIRNAGGSPNASFAHKLGPEVLEQWYTGNVIEETGFQLSLDTHPSNNLTSISQWHKTQFDHAQWRGYAALKLACQSGSGNVTGNLVEFMNWAGEQDDLRLVISLVHERLTLDPFALESLLMDSAQAPAIRCGVL